MNAGSTSRLPGVAGRDPRESGGRVSQLGARVCDILGVRYPIVQAGMASYATPELVAAVSNAGGLGLLGGLDWSLDELRERVEAVRERTAAAFGVNLVLAEPHADKLAYLLGTRVPIISTSWGDPVSVVAAAHGVGSLVLHQVETPDEAAAAARAGVDVIAAQGIDGGGHVGRVGTFALVPAVVDAARGVPVLAAGGVGDGRGLAAALMLGAEGALIGTRFLATPEAGIAPGWKDAIVAAGVADAVQTDVPDLTWGTSWPGATVRVLNNAVIRAWRGREHDVPGRRDELQAAVLAAQAREDPEGIFMYAGHAAGLVREIVPAGDIVAHIVAEAETALTRALPADA